MEEVIKHRVVGMSVLVGVAAVTTLAVFWLTRPSAESEGGPARVYEVTPDGAEPVAASADADEPTETAPTAAPSHSTPRSANASQSEPPKDRSGQTPAETVAEPDTQREPERRPDAKPEQQSTPQRDRPAKSTSTAKTQTPDDAGAQSASQSPETPKQPHWVVQVGSFTEEANAMSLMRQLSEDFAAFYTEGEVNGRTYYRVRVGPFEKQGGAEEAAQRLQARGRGAQIMRAP